VGRNDEKLPLAMAISLPAVILAFIILWLLLDRGATALGSFRGEAGIVVCIVVLAAAVVAERLLTGRSPLQALAALGLRLPNARALVWTVVVMAALLCFYPVFGFLTGAPVVIAPGWYLLIPGLFAQGGIAEETVFRGFLFRHIREGRTFWRAAWLAAVPFVSVHLLLFLSLDLAVAVASVLVAVSLSFPLAWLFERSGNSIWPPAIVHFVVQGSIKLVEPDPNSFLMLAIAWMLLGAAVPWLFFLLREERPS
jgi:membrane protease YdiL (CAAX protease family)